MKISHLILGLLGFVVLFFIGKLIPSLTLKTTFLIIVPLILFCFIFANLRIGLFIFIFVVPFTQQLTIGNIGIDVGTDDLFIIVIILSWLVSLVKSKELHFLKTPLNMPIATYFTSGIFSYIFGIMRFGPVAILVCFLHLMKLLEYVMIYFIAVSVIKNLEQVKKFTNMFFFVTTVVVIIQLYAILTGGPVNISSFSPEEENVLGIAAMSTFGSNAILGAYYCFFIFIILSILIDSPTFKGKIPLIILAFMLSFGLFNTYSRSAYVGFIIGIFVLAMLKERKLLILFFILLLASPILMQSTVLERITATATIKSTTLVFDEATNVRFYLWNKAVQGFLKAPLLGTGYWTTRWVIAGQTGAHTEAHNQFLAVLVEGGLVGFLIYIWLLVRMYKNAFNLKRNANSFFLKGLGVGYIAGFSALLASCFTSENLEAFRMIGPLWFMTALITSANRILERQSSKPDIDST
ncbi:MAG: O-antigen ligase family protein [Candidatus Omnitrophota bacterium]